METPFYIEVHCHQKNHEGERICGDVFLSRRINEESRIVAVLSDGMGHGVKANVLATLTATMAMNFTIEHKDFIRTAEIIMNTLPVCSQRKMSYSTFTIIDIDFDGAVSILQYDNPDALVFRGKQQLKLIWNEIELDSEKNRGKQLRICNFYPRKEDRIIFCSDGITQSGLGTKNFVFGWGTEGLTDFTEECINHQQSLSAAELSARIVKKAYQNDNYHSKDDTSCAVIYFREPRELLLCTGPPYEDDKDAGYARSLDGFNGKKILCGATTADIMARELNREIVDSFDFTDPDLPPVSYMDGVDLITEGILTLSKVYTILSNFDQRTDLGNGPADLIVKMMLDSDRIKMIIGTRINIAHQDPNIPVDLEIRRTVVKRIARKLEEKFLKEVSMEYV